MFDASRPTRGADSELYPAASPDGTRVVFTRGEPDYDVVRIPLDHGGTTPVEIGARQARNDGAAIAAQQDQAFLFQLQQP